MKWFVILVGIFYLILNGYSKGLNEEFTWTRISYALPMQHGQSRPQNFGRNMGYRPSSHEGAVHFPQGNTGTSQNAQSYIYENNVPMGANRWGNKLFITVPRRRQGVPSTLNFVWTNSSERHNVPLIPYPNFEVNQLPSAGGVLVSVYRTAVDACNRLWLVDTGLLEYPGNNTRVHQSAIVIIDLFTDQIIRRYELKSSDVRPDTNLASIVIDVTSTTCNDAYAYLPDLGGYGLVVYSFADNNSWRISHNYFYLEALAGNFLVGGVRFQWNDGIFSVALSDLQPDGHRTVYFHSMAGYNIYSVSSRILKNHTLATRSYHGNDFKVEVDKGEGSQTSGTDLHKTSGFLFLGLVNQNALGCWNTFTPAIPQNFDIVYKNDKTFIYPCDVKIAGDDVIVLTNTMPVFLYGQLDYNQVNFRVWIKNVYEAVRGTKCSIPVPSSHMYDHSSHY